MMVIAIMVVTTIGAWAQVSNTPTQKEDKTLKLNETRVELAVGEKMELKVIPDKATADKKVADAKNDRVEWTSSNKDIVTVDEKGIIRAQKEGRATVTATSGGKRGSCDVNVIKTEK